MRTKKPTINKNGKPRKPRKGAEEREQRKLREILKNPDGSIVVMSVTTNQDDPEMGDISIIRLGANPSVAAGLATMAKKHFENQLENMISH